ncbi:MAG: aquaporin [Gemmatimonadetes bacterium]|nr:aquaporin [Gemmatimonadota bacterium]MCH8254787.1 aquaporin [Gemmatimonadota bacterium]
MGGKLRPLTAEFIGTFGLVFIGAGSIVVNEASGALGLLGVALAHAMVLSVMVTALMRISGAHFNPAVTFGLWLANKIEAKDAGLYVLTQLVAAVVAALLVKTLLPSVAGEITGYGVPRIASNVSLIQAIVLEAILTFFLVSAVFGTAVSPEAPSGIGGFGIGLVLLFDILVGGPLTGAAMNPARAFGPAAIANDWIGQGAFWIGPLLGGAVAALVWGKVLLPKDE